MKSNSYGSAVAIWSNNPNTIQIVSGVECVADALLTRLQTPFLFYDPDFGYDVNALVNAQVDASNIAGLVAKRVQTEMLKDDRVSAAVCDVSFDGVGSLQINIVVTLSGGETFQLVGKGLNDVTVPQLMAFSVLL